LGRDARCGLCRARDAVIPNARLGRSDDAVSDGDVFILNTMADDILSTKSGFVVELVALTRKPIRSSLARRLFQGG